MTLDVDTNEKPFSCQHCRMTFARTDLRTRHIRIQHPDGAAEGSSVSETVGHVTDSGKRRRTVRRDHSIGETADMTLTATGEDQPGLTTTEFDIDAFTGFMMDDPIDWVS